jgi:hypothetical protein
VDTLIIISNDRLLKGEQRAVCSWHVHADDYACALAYTSSTGCTVRSSLLHCS